MEKEKEKIEKNNNSNQLLITVLIILLMCSCAIGGYLYGVSKTFELKNELNSKASYTEKEQEKETNNTENTNNSSSEEIKDLDLTKSLNSNKTYDNVSSENQDVGLEITINDDKKSATITIYEKAAKLISDITHSTWSSDPITRQIKGFDKNIKSAYIGGIGQDAVGTILFFIMEDETVNYVKLFETNTNPDGTTYYSTDITNETAKIKVLPDVNGVIKLYGANAHGINSSGYYTALAAKRDGSFYDLGEIIK